jgi:ribosomal protein S18 acetylase RimI-like enzyme
MKELSIREYTKADIPWIVLLLLELAEVAVPTHQLNEKTVGDLFKQMDSQPQTYKNYVAEQDGDIVGFMSVILYTTVFHKGGLLLINELVVKRGYREQGIGKKLINKAKETAAAHHLDEIEVGTKKENMGAREFYKKCGFLHEYVLLGMTAPQENP